MPIIFFIIFESWNYLTKSIIVIPFINYNSINVLLNKKNSIRGPYTPDLKSIFITLSSKL